MTEGTKQEHNHEATGRWAYGCPACFSGLLQMASDVEAGFTGQVPTIEQSVQSILYDLNLEGEDFDETPRRVAAFLRSFRTDGTHTLPDILKTFTETSENVLVVQGGIPFSGLCAHHLIPFMGTALVGYIPRKRKVGLSKLARLVQAAGRIQPSTQEDITNLVADTLFKELEPIGAGVVTRAWHGCMSVRGVMAPDTWTVASALRGQFLLNPAARAEFMSFWEK